MEGEDVNAARDYVLGVILAFVVAGFVLAAIGCAHTQEAIAALPAGWGESTLALFWAVLFDLYSLIP